MLDTLKAKSSKTVKEAVWSYQEGRYAMDAESRRAFDRLGLAYDSDLDSVKRRYKLLSKQYHPDGGDQASSDAFITMKQSYDTLQHAFQEKGR